MSLLQAHQLKFHYARQEPLFQQVNFEIHSGDRIAVVGPNGAGKTTLLRILAGELEADAGTLVRRRGLRTAYLPQSLRAETDASLGDWLGEPCAEDLDRVLHSLGFDSSDFDTPFGRLSAGERSRASLAKCLLSGADMLLLDEPTNHLDLGARAWLEQHLARLHVGLVIVSHDRSLLETLTTRTFELRRGTFSEYGGGYAFYEKSREERRAAEWAAYEQRARKTAALARASTYRAHLARKVGRTPTGVRSGKDYYTHKAGKVDRTARLLRERLAREPQIEKPWVEQPIPTLDFSHVPRSGEIPIEVAGVCKSYEGNSVLHEVSFCCRRRERWAILGPNGAGKTTLFRLLMGLEAPDRGAVRLGANVRFAYYAQEAENLAPERTPVELCEEVCTDRTWIRTLLACLRLPRALAEQPVGRLSLGERAKVALTRVLVEGANVLLLDEPTNYLEIEAIEALEETLARYPGSIMFVSHDRRFVDRLADHVLELGQGRG